LVLVTDTGAFVVEPAAIVRVGKTGGRPTTLVTLGAGEEIGALAASADTLYFTPKHGTTSNEIDRVPLAGGDRQKVLSVAGGIGDVVVIDKDLVIADRPNTAWEVDSLPGGDVAQITIVASDVGRQPRLRGSPGHVAWSTTNGVSFADL
jgi:hypothetical protein